MHKSRSMKKWLYERFYKVADGSILMPVVFDRDVQQVDVNIIIKCPHIFCHHVNTKATTAQHNVLFQNHLDMLAFRVKMCCFA